MNKSLIILGTALVFLLSGCQYIGPVNEARDTGTPDINASDTADGAAAKDGLGAGQKIGMANPASVNCVNKGGRVEIRKNKQGEYGVCLLEDNRQCEEWALMRGDCPEGGKKITGYDNDAEIFCAITGGQVEGVGTATPMCKRIDGTYCSAQANLDGECPDPHDQNPNAGNAETP